MGGHGYRRSRDSPLEGEMAKHLQEMEEYLRHMGGRLRQLDEQLSHLEAEDDRAVDRGRG